MPRKQSTSIEQFKHPYMKRGFFLRQENQFWLSSTDEEYKERMTRLAESFYPRIQIDLIKTK
jgi:hypothetical protein